VVEAVKNTGRKKLVIAALWSEMCLAQPAIHAMGRDPIGDNRSSDRHGFNPLKD
jgi:hypothetical protein